MSSYHGTVTLNFVDDATGELFAKSTIGAEDLPDSILVETILQLGDEEWCVISAQPDSKSEFTRTGELTLRLRKVESMAPESIGFSQLDITGQFDDDERLGPGEWIETIPLNARIPNPESAGLPALDADAAEVYRVASALSELRESFPIEGDGVYCPICHIASVDLGKLRNPCPRCGRPLLKFGWT